MIRKINRTSKRKLVLHVICSTEGMTRQDQRQFDYLKERIEKELQVKVVNLPGLTLLTSPAQNHNEVNCITQCDLLVAIHRGFSTNCGFEIGLALYHYRKWVLSIDFLDNTVSFNFMRSSKNPKYSHQTVANQEQIVNLIKAMIESNPGLRSIWQRSKSKPRIGPHFAKRFG